MEQTLGKRIMAARKELGLTQDQLAEQADILSLITSQNRSTCCGFLFVTFFRNNIENS